jgi:hypothetical protein
MLTKNVLFEQMLTVLLLCVITRLSCAAQERNIIRNNYHFVSTFLLHPILGDISFSYEQTLSKKLGLEYSAGALYKEIYWKDFGSLGDPEESFGGSGFKFNPARGFIVRLFLKKYTSEEYKGIYFGPSLIYKYVYMPSVRKFYLQSGDIDVNSMNHSDGSEFAFEDKICDYCITDENISKNVLALQYLIGMQGYISNRILHSAYLGVGASFEIINTNIKKLHDQNINYTFTFDHYPVRYYILMPSLQIGYKVGFILSK